MSGAVKEGRKRSSEENVTEHDTKEKKKKSGVNVIGSTAVDKTEYNEWNEMELHPSLMESIYNLGLKKPPTILKVCFPAAAHKGKDLLGVAETGSERILAFALPILQSLLKEQEEADNDGVKGPNGSVRALVLAPNKLAIEVSNDLKELFKGTTIGVATVVGGTSTKEEEFLKISEKIIVGTPEEVKELMLGATKHLAEVRAPSFLVYDGVDELLQKKHITPIEEIIGMLKKMTYPKINQKKMQQLFMFSTTSAFPHDFREKLNYVDELNSLELFLGVVGLKNDAAIFDPTNASIVTFWQYKKELDRRIKTSQPSAYEGFSLGLIMTVKLSSGIYMISDGIALDHLDTELVPVSFTKQKFFVVKNGIVAVFTGNLQVCLNGLKIVKNILKSDSTVDEAATELCKILGSIPETGCGLIYLGGYIGNRPKVYSLKNIQHGGWTSNEVKGRVAVAGHGCSVARDIVDEKLSDFQNAEQLKSKKEQKLINLFKRAVVKASVADAKQNTGGIMRVHRITKMEEETEIHRQRFHRWLAWYNYEQAKVVASAELAKQAKAGTKARLMM